MPPAPPLALELTLPGLVPEDEEVWTAALPRLPTLHRLLARARHSAVACEHMPAFFLASFGVSMQPDWPAAPFSRLGDGADPDEHVWLVADPVCLFAPASGLLLIDSRPLSLSGSEASTLVAAVNEHFAPIGLTLSAPHPQRWYLRVPRALQLRTTPTDAARGNSVDPLLPQGADALLVHGWANEIQMLLHEHPINVAREARGAPPVNSLWLWGAGRLVQPQPPALASVWTADPLLRGLARASGLRVFASPAGGDAWMAHAQPGQHAVLLEHAEAASSANWYEYADRLERQWFAPLLAALAARRLRQVTLATHRRGQMLRFSTTPGDLWKVWRQRIDLAHG